VKVRDPYHCDRPRKITRGGGGELFFPFSRPLLCHRPTWAGPPGSLTRHPEGVLVSKRSPAWKGSHPMKTDNIPAAPRPAAGRQHRTDRGRRQSHGFQDQVGIPFDRQLQGDLHWATRRLSSRRSSTPVPASFWRAQDRAECNRIDPGLQHRNTREPRSRSDGHGVPTSRRFGMSTSRTGGLRSNAPYLSVRTISRQASLEPGRAPSREGAPAGQSHPTQPDWIRCVANSPEYVETSA